MIMIYPYINFIIMLMIFMLKLAEISHIIIKMKIILIEIKIF